MERSASFVGRAWPTFHAGYTLSMSHDLLLHAYAAWCAADVEEKLARAEALAKGHPLPLPPGLARPDLDAAPANPGRPARPVLVSAQALAHRSASTPEGRAALLHAIAHIEFNAVDLALDIVWRFPGQPENFVQDWIRIAGEEALHFRLLAAHLQSLGHAYGDFPAHGGLWDMASRTAGDLLHRLALVPRVLEARGLDASPALRDKLAQAGDTRAADILQRILDDEIGHVAAGTHWFRHCCAQRGLDPEATFLELLSQYRAPRLADEPNHAARTQAGFTPREMEGMAQSARTRTPSAR
jgi:uncharacterized ferritin-like protein (DUF455 family)